MNVMLQLVCLSIIVVFIVDESGIIDTIKYKLAYFLSKYHSKSIYNKNSIDLRPFECSLCMVFWTGSLMLLFTSQFSLVNFTLVCILSFFTRTIKDLFDMVQSLFDWAINIIYNKLK